MSEFYDVEDIIEVEKRNGKLFALVLWKGYTMEESTWEPISNLKNIKWMIDDFIKNKKKLEASMKKNKKNNKNTVLNDKEQEDSKCNTKVGLSFDS
jgi:hypothetical protein